MNTGGAALDIGRLDAGTLTGSALTVTAGDMTTASSLAFTGVLTLNPTGTLTVSNTVSATGAVTVNATGAVTGSGGLGAGSDLTLNASSVGSALTPLMLGTVDGQLSGTLSGTLASDVYNVQSLAASILNLGVITATAGGTGHPVTIDSNLGSILHVHVGTDITGGRVNFWGTQIGTLGFDLLVVTDNPPVFCNGTPCGLPYFVNGSSALFGLTNTTTTLSDNVLYLLKGSESEEPQLLTAGVLPTNLYSCLSLDREQVVCTAGAMWHDDDGSDGAVVQTAQDEQRQAKRPAQRVSAPRKSKVTSKLGVTR